MKAAFLFLTFLVGQARVRLVKFKQSGAAQESSSINSTLLSLSLCLCSILAQNPVMRTTFPSPSNTLASVLGQERDHFASRLDVLVLLEELGHQSSQSLVQALLAR